MGYLAELDPDDPALGGKARSLAILAAAGYPTPAAFVITGALFQSMRAGGPVLPDDVDVGVDFDLAAVEAVAAALELAPFPPGFEAALEERLALLGADRLAVRSSFAAEDDPDAVAPGVYESRVGVSRTEVAAAVRAVLRSAVAPGAVAYALARGQPPAAPPVAVLVHRHVSGEAGRAALDPTRGEMVVSPGAGVLTPAAATTIEAALRALAARRGGVELEWVTSGRQGDDMGGPTPGAAAPVARSAHGQGTGEDTDDVTFLQLRPYRAPPPARVWAGLAALPPGERATWRWDAAHNPLPLSPAQAGLVALVDERCRIGIRQRVLGGYLFHAPGGPAPARSIPAAGAAPELAALRGLAERRLAALGPTPALDEALALFVDVYEPLFGVIQPAARAARRELEQFLRAHLPAAVAELPALLAGVESMASERRRRAASPDRAAYLDLFGDEAAVWDVAVPTYREAPHLLPAPAGSRDTAPPPGSAVPSTKRQDATTPWAARAGGPEPTSGPSAVRPPGVLASWRFDHPNKIALEGLLARLPPALHRTAEQLVSVARAAAAVAEDDDWLYARVQTGVRRALLALGARLQRDGGLDDRDDVFFCPLPVARALAAGGLPLPSDDLRALARAGRDAMAAARNDPPPGTAGPEPSAGAVLLRGSGTGGRALGRVRLHDRARHVTPGDPTAVLVADTLLPTELPLLDAAALVTETGGPLDHVAAQARERGLPAVVGVAGATRRLREGDLVLVDADQGVVVKLR